MSDGNIGATRRNVLKKVGSGSVVGLGMVTSLSGTASAFHCVSDPEDDSLYEDKVSADSEDVDQSVKIASSTELAHIKTISSNDKYNHVFYFVTTSGSELINEDWAPSIGDHEVELEVDTHNFNSATVDFCNSTTGVYPAEDNEAVNEVWDFLAGQAIDVLSSKVSIGLDVLKTASAVADSFDRETGPQYQRLEYEHRGYGDAGYPQEKTKVQGTFEVTHDKDESGELRLRSKTKGYAPDAYPCGTDCPETTTENILRIVTYTTGAVTVHVAPEHWA